MPACHARPQIQPDGRLFKLLASTAVGAVGSKRYTLSDFFRIGASNLFKNFYVRSNVATATIVCVLCWCLTLTACVFAQSATRTPNARTTLAEPKPQGASPFLPSANRDVRLPVTLEGFCIVTLRERQKWLPGSESNQLVFDGQLYWFAGQRQRAIFAATPQRYVPALGGNCVVTFAESGIRERGDPQFGILHNKQLFFFRSQAEQEKFQSEPNQFTDLDLANEGRCLVSQIDDERQLPGLPETTVIVDGLRYLFAGIHQQHKFLVNMPHYGVTRPKTPQADKSPKPLASNPLQPLASDGSSSRSKAKQGKTPANTSVADVTAEVTNKAMSGYCPVTIHDQGTWVMGDARYQVEFDGLTYLMASEALQKLFVENPNTYIPALGGHCVVTEIDENRRVLGSTYHAMWHEGENRIFLFAGAKQKEAFDASPATYVHADLVAEGNCIVTLIDEGKEIAGLPELLLWHQGKRYLFASQEQQDTFRENIQRYQDR